MTKSFSKADNQILWLLKILLGICLFAPVFISSAMLFPYTAPKAFAFRMLVEIALVFYFYLLLKKSPLVYPLFKKGEGARSLKIAVLTFLLVWFLSALFGVDSYLSFWGNLERMQGVWGLTHFVLFFLMLISVFKTEKGWLVLLKISVLVSLVVSVLAIIQKFIGLGLLMPRVDRVFGTIGNAAFLGSYLIFNIFFAGYLALSSSGREKWLLAIGDLLLLISLFFTGTRGAILGLAGGAIFCLIIFSFFSPAKKIKKYSLAALILLLVVGSLIFTARNSSLVKNNSVLQRITAISLRETTAKNRLILWQGAWQAWKEKPIFGWGPENFEVAANKYFDPRLNLFEEWYDRAHNFIFDYGVASGWVGLLSYLSLLVAGFYCLKKIALNSQFARNIKERKVSFSDKENFSYFYFSVLFSGFLLAYLVSNFFVFDSFVSYLMLFFALAAIERRYALWRKEAGKKQPRDRAAAGGDNAGWPRSVGRAGAVSEEVNLTFGKKILLAVIILAVIFSLYFLNLKPISASIAASQVLSFGPLDYVQNMQTVEKALLPQTFGSEEIAYQVTFDYLAKTQTAPQLTQNEKFYNLSSKTLSSAIDHSPFQARNYVALAWLNLYFSDQRRERIDEAIGLAKKAKALSPNKKDSYLILTAAYSMKGDNQKAQEIVEQALTISPALGQEVRQFWQSLK